MNGKSDGIHFRALCALTVALSLSSAPAAAAQFLVGPSATPTQTGYDLAALFQCTPEEGTPCSYDAVFTLGSTGPFAFLTLNQIANSPGYSGPVDSVLWNGTEISGTLCTPEFVLEPVSTCYFGLPTLAENTLEVIGTTDAAGNRAAPIGGNIYFTDTAVPEPATWAMMLLGFAAIGFAARRRRDGAQSIVAA